MVDTLGRSEYEEVERGKVRDVGGGYHEMSKSMFLWLEVPPFLWS